MHKTNNILATSHAPYNLFQCSYNGLGMCKVLQRIRNFNGDVRVLSYSFWIILLEDVLFQTFRKAEEAVMTFANQLERLPQNTSITKSEKTRFG